MQRTLRKCYFELGIVERFCELADVHSSAGVSGALAAYLTVTVLVGAHAASIKKMELDCRLKR